MPTTRNIIEKLQSMKERVEPIVIEDLPKNLATIQYRQKRDRQRQLKKQQQVDFDRESSQQNSI